MINEIVDLLNKNIGRELRFANLNGGIEGIIEEVHIEGEILSVNNINIDLEEYTINKILDKNLISFHSSNLGIALILIK